MTVDIEVTTEAPYTGVVIESNTAKFIMVALGSDDRPTPVPPLEGESDE
jgi:acyl-CoA hydrolase